MLLVRAGPLAPDRSPPDDLTDQERSAITSVTVVRARPTGRHRATGQPRPRRTGGVRPRLLLTRGGLRLAGLALGARALRAQVLGARALARLAPGARALGDRPALAGLALTGLAQLAPVRLVDFDVELLRGFDDPLPGRVLFRVGDALDLVEPGNGAADVLGVGQGLFALLRERVDVVRQLGLRGRVGPGRRAGPGGCAHARALPRDLGALRAGALLRGFLRLRGGHLSFLLDR